MGTEIKTPESCETLLRNRKKKEKKVETEEPNPIEEDDDDLKIKLRNSTDENSWEKSESFTVVQSSEGGNFSLKLEFDPMSVALLVFALLTRFYRLAEPRHVV